MYPRHLNPYTEERWSKYNDKPLKLTDYFTYLGSNISSSESNDNICIGKALTAIDRLLIV